MRKFLAVLGGLVAMSVSVAAIEAISHTVYPPPIGLDFNDAAAINEYIKILPTGAFMFLLLAHFAGTFIGAVTAIKIARDGRIIWPLIVGVVALIGGAVNLVLISHPGWFMVADLCTYLPAALLANYVVRG